MRISLGDRAATFDVVPHHGVGQGKMDGRAIGQVRNDQTVGLPTVLLDDDDVGEVIVSAHFYELFHLGVTPIDSLGIWKY